MDPIFTNAVFPDMVNGDIENIVNAPPRTSIPDKFKFVMLGTLNSQVYKEDFLRYFRATLATMLYPDWTGLDDANKAARVLPALALAAVRIGIISAWSLTPGHLSAGEAMTLALVPGTAAGRIARAAQATPGTADTLGAVIDHVNGVVVPAGYDTSIGQLATFALVIPALQGWSLTSYGHHYLSNHQSAKAYATAWRQASIRFPDTLKNRFGMQEAEWADLVYHKSAHAINMNQKRAWAKSAAVPLRLAKAGFPGASVRLPAIPADAMVVKAGRAVILKASHTLRQAGAIISTDIVDQLIADLHAAVTDQEEAPLITRARAWGDLNSESIALCAGVVAYQDSLSISGGAAETTTRAYAVKKAMMAHPSATSRGQAIAKAVREAEAKSLVDGHVALEMFV